MNRLSVEKRAKIIQLLVEGNSIRSTSRIMDVSKLTVTRLLVTVGAFCIKFHDDTVHNIRANRIEVDEIWSFVHKKEKQVPKQQKGRGVGDVWTWTAIDAETKLIITWFVGNRDTETAKFFMRGLAKKVPGQFQLTSDGFLSYPEAVKVSFYQDIDYAQQDKKYGIRDNKYGKPDKRKRYLGSDRVVKSGNPNPKYITTNHIERQNLTIRMSNRRFTRQTNAFSKKLDNHCYSLGLTFVYYNFIRLHQTLRVTPAMRSGLTKRFMSIEDLVIMAENSK